MSLKEKIHRSIPQSPIGTQIVTIPPSQIECSVAKQQHLCEDKPTVVVRSHVQREKKKINECV